MSVSSSSSSSRYTISQNVHASDTIFSEEFTTFITHLPRISKSELTTDGCPICLLPWDGIEQIDLESESELDLSGITKLSGCGHTFCRKEYVLLLLAPRFKWQDVAFSLAQWILGGHGSCPICRHVFLSIAAEVDLESSDDDYIPSSDIGNDVDSLYESDWMDADQDWEDEDEEDQDLDLGEVAARTGETYETHTPAAQDRQNDTPSDDLRGMYDSDAGLYFDSNNNLEVNAINPACS